MPESHMKVDWPNWAFHTKVCAMSLTRKQFKLNNSFQVSPGTALIKQRSSDFVGETFISLCSIMR